MSFNVAAKAASLALSGGNNDAETEVVVECNSVVFVSKSGVVAAASKSVVVNPSFKSSVATRESGVVGARESGVVTIRETGSGFARRKGAARAVFSGRGLNREDDVDAAFSECGEIVCMEEDKIYSILTSVHAEYHFLDASTHLYKRVCPSVDPSAVRNTFSK